ncbi:putative 3-hydroxyisobutyrate dehydrogenase [Pseudoprimorskyibacter insulae]|uniref:3-hydroxyisobutyrate dehydrogenase n=2 Tax=Pseudoprimorskyibacter insulae TaxID=1695997 RepID=A0A2R8AXN6_9RHOB|nr:putative 3-hydroxyisobutyrate dehydrogenase [Pseudoprimorskyibacter insulae]
MTNPDVQIRINGRAGHITLTRPQALNALNHDMCTAIEQALDAWRDDPAVHLIILDATGERAFCAGGDIAAMYNAGKAGDYDTPRSFWREEYRLNTKLAEYPKPIVSFLHGFVMGGGVGLGGHVSHRIVGESTQIAMPECGIGFVPDVGGTYRLALAPGRLGEYFGLTGARMGPAEAIRAGFADMFIPEADWPELKNALATTGKPSVLIPATPPESTLPEDDINALFAGEALQDILNTLRASDSEFAAKALKTLQRNSPLSMAATLEMIHRLRSPSLDIRKALELEYRVSHRIMEHGDFIEGVRAQIIDKDRTPTWKHALDKVPAVDVSLLLRPLGKEAWTFEETGMNIAFIGLGNMGGPMAANLIKAGHSVTGFDVAGTTVEGARVAASAAEAAKGADVVITMLPNGAILRAVAADVIPAMTPGAVLLDCSTVDVESARAVADLAAAAGLGALDAPVSGGIGGAAAGTLTFMVGGSDEAFAIAKPLFDIMGQKAVHCGPSGNGQAAKICNNMILGVTMIATCEAFALADKLGLDRQSMFDVVSTSSGYSWTMNAYCPAPGVGPNSPADNGYKPGFASELMLKDLGLSQQAAEAADADTPMGQRALELYKQFVEAEDGKGMDFSAMLPRFEKRGRG